MIKIKYFEDTELREWYWKNVKEIVKANIAKVSKETIWKRRLLVEEVLYDIIFRKINFLRVKYEWIDCYMDDEPSNCDNEEIRNLIGTMPQKVRRELVKKMNVRVCPYCNQQYIYALSSGSGKYLGDLDHVLPKSKYPLFSFSLWNLVPSCKSCNQSFKNMDSSRILSPIEAGFGNDCVFRVKFNSASAICGSTLDFDIEWFVNPTGKNKDLISNNIRVFMLNEMYCENKEEIRNILWKKHIYKNRTYTLGIHNMLLDSGCKKFNGEQLDLETIKFIWGEAIFEDNFINYPHSKMLHDIVFDSYQRLMNND